MKKTEITEPDFIKHTHLTKLFKKHGADVYNVYQIFLNCDISKYVGSLPSELRNLVPIGSLSAVTNAMFKMLETLVLEMDGELEKRNNIYYDLDEIGNLFNTKCVLQTCDLTDTESKRHGWFGVVGNVYKLSFPEINVSYALKIFKGYRGIKGHGAQYEIPTAFCANNCEPKLNNPVYMAVVLGGQCMLSKWADSCSDTDVNIFYDDCAIYQTTYQESRTDNFKDGKRIDFGATYKTEYGSMKYPARKLFRKMKTMTSEQILELKQKIKNNFEKSDFETACKLHEFLHENTH